MKLRRVSKGPLPEPKPVMNHLVGNGVQSQHMRFFFFKQVARDLDARWVAPEKLAASGNKPPGTRAQAGIPDEDGFQKKAVEKCPIDRLKSFTDPGA